MFSRNLTLIDAYSRKQAIEDGVLVDITELAKTKGFVCNVCVTAAVWAMICDIPENFKWQDKTGRLWDLLNILYYKGRGSKSPVVQFKVHMPHEVTIVDPDKPDSKGIAEYVDLVSIVGPGDEGELVVTIQLPNED
jgi:hypothetical protein